MRVLACTILTIGTMLVAAPACAQTYDPNYPVCLQTYGIEGGYIDCSFTSLAQCAASASGRGGAVPEQSVFRAGRQETASAPRRLLERFPAKACPGLDPGWRPVRVRKTRQIKNLEPVPIPSERKRL